MAINCEFAPFRKQYGYAQDTWNRLKDHVGDKLSVGRFTNVVRNVGLDDTRMVNLVDAEGKRFFSKNISKISDLDYEKEFVPKDVVVRVPTKNGEQFYVSNKDTKLPPSRWVRDEASGRVTMNADWDALGKNVTGMKKYVRESDGYWREAKAGEDGSFLNIQNPAKGEQTISKTVSNNIDAFEKDGRYKLIEESTQAVNPFRVTEKPSRANISMSTTKELPTTQQISQKLTEYDIPTRVAYAIGGGIAGDMADSDDEFAGTFWGGALGLALGSKKVRGKIKGTFNRAEGVGDDPLDEAILSVVRQEKMMDKVDEAKRRGYEGDLTDEDAVDEFIAMRRQHQTKKEQGFPVFKDLFDNSLFRSGIGLLSGLSKTAKKFSNVLEGFQDAHSQMYSKLNLIQNTVFNSRNGKQAFKDAQLNFIRSFDQYNDLDEDRALQAFGSAIYRLRTFGGRLEDGQLKWEDSPAANYYYRDDITRDIDRQLLESEEARKVYDVVSRFFDERHDETIDILNKQIKKELDDIGNQDVVDTLIKFASTGLSLKQFKKSLGKDDLVRVNKYLQGKYGDPSLVELHKQDIKRITSMIEDRVRFNKLKGKYIPQKISSVREGVERKKWEQRNQADLRGVSENEKAKLWEDYKVSRILEVNKEKWNALDITSDGLDAEVRYYETINSAKKGLEALVYEIEDSTARSIVLADMKGSSFAIKDYLEEQVLPNGKTVYNLVTPQKFRDRFPRGLFESLNRDQVTKANRAFTTLNMASRADFFDRPRNLEIPLEFKELDLEQLTKFYSEDMGIRLRSIENGMYDTPAIEKYWVQPIREEVVKRGNPDDIKRLPKKLDEVRRWISVMQRERPTMEVGTDPIRREQIARENKAKAKNDSLFNSAAKLVTFPFNYGTTLYSAFTPAVFGPFITSWKSILGEYKNAVYAPDQLKQFTRELEKMGVIEKKFTAYAQEYTDQYKQELLGDPSSWRRKFADLADNVTEFSANLSIARMMGIDPERLGIGRLMIGNMLDISGAEAGLVTMAAFRHAEELIDVSDALLKKANVNKWIDLNKNEVVNFNGTRYTKESIEEQLGRLGVDNTGDFLEGSQGFQKTFRYMRGEADISDMDPKYYHQLAKMANNVVDQYHARTKLSRPLKWLDNVWGRALSRYSVYAQNFGVQTTSRRIYRPLKDWADNYTMNDESIPFFKVAWWASTGNDKKFKEVFGDNWEQAYNDFPVDAVNNFYKVFGALAVGKAMMITRGGILDLTGMASNEMVGNDDYEAWRNVNKQMVLGYDADTNEPFTFEDLFSGDVQGFDLLKLFSSSLAGASRLGFGLRYAQVFTEDMKYPQGGIAEMTPVTGFPNEIFERFSNIINTPTTDIPKTISRETIEFLALRANPFATYYDARKPIVNTFLNKPKNRGIKFVESGTGNDLDVNFYDF